jgi:hypothetical protein
MGINRTLFINIPGLPRPHPTPLAAGVVFRPRKDDREIQGDPLAMILGINILKFKFRS